MVFSELGNKALTPRYLKGPGGHLETRVTEHSSSVRIL